ncbi:MAG: hypothetical protein Kow006_30010 [Gammaproteobacteria bacterium]
MPPDTLLNLRVTARAEVLQTIRRRLERVLAAAGISREAAHTLVVAVNEACMNVIQHAYGEHRSGDLVLEVEADEEKLLFRLKDYAPRIDTQRLRGRDLEEVRPGGLGLPLIQQIMDEVHYPEPPPGIGNCLEMLKYRDRAVESNDGNPHQQ